MRPGRNGSIYDVAKEARVSIGTVSRVFNNKHDVAEQTRSQVLNAARRVRYMPKISARRVSIGVVVPEIAQANQVGFISGTISTLARHVAKRGAVLELLPMDDLEAIYRNYIRGLIAIVFGPKRAPLASVRDVPVVMINNRYEGANFHTVASDHAQGGRIAAQHLLDRGHKRIGFLEVRGDNWGARERERGFREAFESARVKFSGDLVAYVQDGPPREPLMAMLKLKPTALLVCGEDLSLAVNQILLHELKIKVPEELSLITYETPNVTCLLTPPQTAVSQPWEDIGRIAVETILSLIGKPMSRPPDVMLPNTLIERTSIKSLPR